MKQEEEEKQIATRSSKTQIHIPSTKDPDFDKLLKTDVDFARKIAKLALIDLSLHLHNNKSSIIYGTNEGSIG